MKSTKEKKCSGCGLIKCRCASDLNETINRSWNNIEPNATIKSTKEKKSPFTKKELKEIERAFKICSYDLTFEKENERGWKEKWIVMPYKKFTGNLASERVCGYNDRIEEEKTISVFDLVENNKRESQIE